MKTSSAATMVAARATTPRQRLARRLAIATAILGLSCGGGMDEPPVCPTGDCTLPSRTIVRWSLNAHPELLFPGDTCNDLGVRTMRVELAGIDDPAVSELQEIDCNQAQASFLGLPAGTYNAALTALDGGGNPIVTGPTTAMVTAGTADQPTTTSINIPYESWTGSYTGTLLFRLKWAGASCEAAVPNVVMQTLTLMVGGTPTAILTDVGQKLDGTDPKPCRQLDEPFAQFAEGLPMGPVTLNVVGTDGVGAVAFDTTFDTFVGAAKNNPTIEFDVEPPPPPMDGGVDAPMD